MDTLHGFGIPCWDVEQFQLFKSNTKGNSP